MLSFQVFQALMLKSLQWNLGKAPRLFGLSPLLPQPYLGLLWPVDLYGLDEILIQCLHFVHLIIQPPFLFLDIRLSCEKSPFQPEQGSWIETFSYVLPFKKKLIITFLFIVENWILGVDMKWSWEFSVWPLVSQPVAFPSSSQSIKFSFHFHYCVSRDIPQMSYPLTYGGGIKGTWFIERE